MSDNRSFSSRDDNQQKGDRLESPPMSRLFIICNKSHSEEDFRDSFSKYGSIEDVWVVKDKNSGENKGVAYIKFAKTSDAAQALEELNGKCIGGCDRPIKVLVAATRNVGSKRQAENEQEKCVRLFVVTPKTATEEILRDEFCKFGDIEHISVIKDKNTGQAKGFAYIKFKRFYHAALAFENCPSKYRAVFADPKGSRSDSKGSDSRDSSRYDDSANMYTNMNRGSEMSGFMKMQSSVNQPTCLEVICSNQLNQDQMWRLFDIVPGLDYCQITGDYNQRCSEATVVYTNPDAASYAKEKMHGLEYPPGERLIVKLAGMDSKLEQQLNDKHLKRDSICSVNLPPSAPLADANAPTARRCFIVVSSNIPNQVLRNVFCTFENLIEVYLLPNKNCGYAKYASAESAQKAIDTLHGAEVCGARLKVMEALDPKDESRKRMRRDD